MKKVNLGALEEEVLTMVAILGKEAYGQAIVQELKAQVDRTVNLGSVHVTLYRLEDKELVRSHMGGATRQRGGRRKRLFEITNAGLATLKALKAKREALWKFIPQLQMMGA